MEDQLLAFVIVVYSWGVSWIQERFGTFQDLDAKTKQLVNAIFGFIVPAIVLWIVPAVTGVFGNWPAELGAPEGFVTTALMVVVPVFVWVLTQVWHYVDLSLERLAKGST